MKDSVWLYFINVTLCSLGGCVLFDMLGASYFIGGLVGAGWAYWYGVHKHA